MHDLMEIKSYVLCECWMFMLYIQSNKLRLALKKYGY